jgi:hypothetical protein
MAGSAVGAVEDLSHPHSTTGDADISRSATPGYLDCSPINHQTCTERSNQ